MGVRGVSGVRGTVLLTPKKGLGKRIMKMKKYNWILVVLIFALCFACNDGEQAFGIS